MSLEYRHIAHAYGEVTAVRDVSFTAAAGEITCLLGSSGCGKSTLLNLAAGLLNVQAGQVLVNGEVMAASGNNPPPEQRPVGLVFQDGALFPHMTIARNVAFGLPRADAAMIEGWLEQVGLSGLGARYPHELSGGQQQRAALARAMAPGPDVLLMDEPFASVDIVLRRRLRRDCRRLLRERGTTTVMVTHDPEEALDIADRIAVMAGGRIVQVGSPDDLHERPATAAVGAIFGGAQIMAGRQEEGGLATPLGLWPVESVAGELPDTTDLDLLIHAETLDCVADETGMEVLDVHPLGVASRVIVRGATGEEIMIQTTSPVVEGARYRIVPRDGSIRAFIRDQ